MLDWTITYSDGSPAKVMAQLTQYELNVVEAAVRGGYATCDREPALKRLELERQIRSQSR